MIVYEVLQIEFVPIIENLDVVCNLLMKLTAFFNQSSTSTRN